MPAGGAQIKATGFEFVAARSNPAVLLQSIPKSWVSHSGWTGNFVNPVLDFQSPVAPGTNAPQNMTGYSVYVLRSNNRKFSPGTDEYDPQLASGWTFDSVQMTSITTPPSCPVVVTYKESFGSPGFAEMIPMSPDWTKLQRHGVRVIGSDTSCSGFIPIAPPFVFWTYSDATETIVSAEDPVTPRARVVTIPIPDVSRMTAHSGQYQRIYRSQVPRATERTRRI